MHKTYFLAVFATLLGVPSGCQSSKASGTPSSDAGRDSGGADANPACAVGTSDAASCTTCMRQGLAQGKAGDGICTYLGIPYAKPPVADRRFAAPEPADGWTGVRDATQFATACVQGGSGVALTGGATTGEDCLYLNVWAPANAGTAPLPVMVFIYGGGYTTGATNTYIGTGLAKAGPVVVVSMNYRLGALGFFAHPDLDGQRAGAPSGSDGIRDQQLALRWVRDNIAQFHGDPTNVTLFGESAGSSAIGVHVVSPGSRGLITRFIMESGVSTRGVAGGIEPDMPEQRYRVTEQMAAELCPGAPDVIACLRQLPADRIMQWTAPRDADGGTGAGPILSWVPVIEGKGGVLPDSPDALMESDQFNPGEILVGTNKNEFGFFQLIGAGATVSTLAEMRARVEAQFGARVDDIMKIYAPDASVDASKAYVTLMTDVMFRCQTRHFARLAASKGRKVHLYSFEQGTAVHSEELIYVFGAGNFALALNSSPVASLVDAVQSYWLDFARTGDPNGEGLAVWPAYDAPSDRNMTLADPPVASSGLQRAGCDYWDAYLALGGN